MDVDPGSVVSAQQNCVHFEELDLFAEPVFGGSFSMPPPPPRAPHTAAQQQQAPDDSALAPEEPFAPPTSSLMEVSDAEGEKEAPAVELKMPFNGRPSLQLMHDAKEVLHCKENVLNRDIVPTDISMLPPLEPFYYHDARVISGLPPRTPDMPMYVQQSVCMCVCVCLWHVCMYK
jgi:hypothetical protein